MLFTRTLRLSPTAMEWFYAGADEHVGPFSETQIAALVKSGAVSQDTLVWREGMDLWIPISQAFPPRVPPPIPFSTRSAPAAEHLASVTRRPPDIDGVLDRVERSGENARAYWDGLARERKVLLVLGGLGVLFAFELILDVRGIMLSLVALLTFLGVIQAGKRPKLARVLTTWGPAFSVVAAFAALSAGDMKDIPHFVSVYDWGGDGDGFAVRVALTAIGVYVLSRRMEARADEAPPDAEPSTPDGDALQEAVR